MKHFDSLLHTLLEKVRAGRAGLFVPHPGVPHPSEPVPAERGLYRADFASWGLEEGYQPTLEQVQAVAGSTPTIAAGTSEPFRLFEDDEMDFLFPEGLPLWSPV